MGCFFGKIKNRTGSNKEKIKKILEGSNANYENYSSEEIKNIKFDPHYKLEKSETFYLDYDEKLKKIINNNEILEIDDTNTTIYNQINSENWESLDFIIYSDESNLFFQRIIGKKYLTTKKKLGMNTGIPELKEEKSGIDLNKYPDLIYSNNSKKIFFKDFSKLDKILSGIDELYRTATVVETTAFLNSDFIEAKNFDVSSITVPKRKKIAQAIDKLKDMDIASLREYGKKYRDGIFIEDRIIITETNDIDIALDIIFEKYYTTEVTKEKREANSVRTI